ncbi:hypothetical protein [Rhodococcus sp. AW25M09]|uniref:hypothetical protein n=1 Tax=Rhodococcus sp. AW25M09 TaxID=1268303 RepID=UPI0005B55686|nr:hypothetical protein [Rhodococcus sp. AW25M09]
MSNQRSFRKYVTAVPLNKKDGATRSDYRNAIVLAPTVGIGFFLAQLVVQSDSKPLDIAVGCVGGAITGFLYLYLAYRVDSRPT